MEWLGAAKFEQMESVAKNEHDSDGYEHECHHEVRVVPGAPFVHAFCFECLHVVFYGLHVDFG